jgi:hypothetical protein
MKEIDDSTKPQEQISRERRLSSPASPWLQSLQPASHPRLLPLHPSFLTPKPCYFALNQITDKFSFKKACQLSSAGQYKTGSERQNVYWT